MIYTKRKYYNYNTKDNTIKYLMITMFLGSILGALFGAFIDDNSIQKIDVFLDSFITQENNIQFDLMYFLEVFFKGLKYFLSIWFLGFIPFGYIFIYLIVFSKGFFISFTTTIFFSKYYFEGLKYVFNMYVIENIIIIALIFYISYKAIKYCKDKMKKRSLNIKSYIKTLIICIIINIVLFFFFNYI